MVLVQAINQLSDTEAASSTQTHPPYLGSNTSLPVLKGPKNWKAGKFIPL